jgi:hypothetical protein
MPFVDDPHYCKPPIWPWLYRVNQVWKCPKCADTWRLGTVRGGKVWIPLNHNSPYRGLR